MQRAEVVPTLKAQIYLKILKKRAGLCTNEVFSANIQLEEGHKKKTYNALLVN